MRFTVEVEDPDEYNEVEERIHERLSEIADDRELNADGVQTQWEVRS